MPALVAAGAVAGAVLGWSQARVLKQRIPALSKPWRIGATAAAASLAWFIGPLPGGYPEVWQGGDNFPAHAPSGASARYGLCKAPHANDDRRPCNGSSRSATVC